MKNPLPFKVFAACALGLLMIVPGAHAREPRQVAVLEVAPETPQLRLELPGRVVAPGTVGIRTEEEGRLLSVAVEAGDRVDAGEELARIDDTLLRASLDKAIANRKQAEMDLKRQLELRKSHVATEDEVTRARTALQVAQAEEAVLRTRIARTRIRAPFAGSVVRRMAEPGTVLGARDDLLLLQPATGLRVETWIPVQLLPLARQARWTLQDAAGQPLGTARLEFGEPAAAAESQTVHIRLLPGKSLSLAPGSRIAIGMSVTAPAGIWLPLSAIGEDSQGRHVMIVDAGKARRVAVETGPTISGKMLVSRGLQPGTRVIIRGLGGLHEGDAVRIHEEDGHE